METWAALPSAGGGSARTGRRESQGGATGQGAANGIHSWNRLIEYAYWKALTRQV